MAGTNRLRAAALLLASAVALLAAVALGPFHPAHAQTPPEDFVPGEILVKFEPGTSGQERAEAHEQTGGQVEEVIPDIGVRVVDVPAGREQSIVAAYERNPDVSYAEVNGVIRLTDHGTPNDKYVGAQWQYNNIDAFEAWHETTGSATVEIAILDSGIDPSHVDLRTKIVKHHNITNSRTAGDRYGHGTHVAGSAAAVTGNTAGVAGTCPGCSLYNVKVVNDKGRSNVALLAAGIRWAADNGAEVINMSLGTSTYTSTLEVAVDYAWGKGVVLVAAAGNQGVKRHFYPAAYPNVIAVAATNYNDVKPGFSNYGTWVDVAAPGVDILSTAPDHRSVLWPRRAKHYARLSGTSMATPHVAGVAGLVLAAPDSSGVNKLCTTKECVRERIQDQADDITGTGTLWEHGRINAHKSVLPPPPPGPSG